MPAYYMPGLHVERNEDIAAENSGLDARERGAIIASSVVAGILAIILSVLVYVWRKQKRTERQNAYDVDDADLIEGQNSDLPVGLGKKNDGQGRTKASPTIADTLEKRMRPAVKSSSATLLDSDGAMSDGFVGVEKHDESPSSSEREKRL